jgi:hypothetical protein
MESSIRSSGDSALNSKIGGRGRDIEDSTVPKTQAIARPRLVTGHLLPSGLYVGVLGRRFLGRTTRRFL